MAATTCAGHEEASVWPAAERAQMVAERLDELGVRGHRANSVARAMLEMSFFTVGAVVGPCGARLLIAARDEDASPPFVRKGQLAPSKVPDLGWPSAGEVKGCEEGVEVRGDLINRAEKFTRLICVHDYPRVDCVVGRFAFASDVAQGIVVEVSRLDGVVEGCGEGCPLPRRGGG